MTYISNTGQPPEESKRIASLFWTFLLSIWGVSFFLFAHSDTLQPSLFVSILAFIGGTFVGLAMYGAIKLWRDYRVSQRRVRKIENPTERQRQLIEEMKNEIVRTYYEATEKQA